MFSARLPSRLAPTPLSQAIAAARARQEPLLDLTETNPTVVGIMYPDAVTEAMSDVRAARYQPDARGLMTARQAVADDYARRGQTVEADRIILTASTSEAYGFLFKLLCNAGDDVLVPQPSYPLFELLTGLEGVRARTYRLAYHGAWSIDRTSLEESCTRSTRAVLVVSPNNPTGSMLRADDRDWLIEFAARQNVALIADEVFADYPLAPRPDAVSLAGQTGALTFVLGGLSKSCGLPQMKLAWLGVSGPEPTMSDAIVRLDIIADTYLSVSTPVQLAAPKLLSLGRDVRNAIASRISANLACLSAVVRASPRLTLLGSEGGWSAVVRVPAVDTEEAIVTRLLAEERVLAQPGYFFDFATEAFLVVSLLPEPGVFREAASRLGQFVGRLE